MAELARESNDKVGLHHHGKLGNWGSVFAILSTIIGGGMVSIPWAFYCCGFPIAMLLLLFSSAQVVVSCMLYLKAKNICPENPTSMFELSFLIFGRYSIYWIAFPILINSFMMPIIYFNVFSEIMKGLIVSMTVGREGGPLMPEEVIWTSRAFWVLALGLLLLPIVLLKELAEMKWVSITLFIATMVFVLINISQVAVRGNSLSNFDSGIAIYFEPKQGKEFIQSIAIINLAVNFHVNLFSVNASQIDQSIRTTIRNIVISLILACCVYVFLTISSIVMYGSHIAQSLLVNIGISYRDNRVYVESYVMQLLFLVVLAAHIPFVFFSAKESLLIMIDEFMRRSISLTLSKKMLPNLEDNMKKSIRLTQRMSQMNNRDHQNSGSHGNSNIVAEDLEDLFHDRDEI